MDNKRLARQKKNTFNLLEIHDKNLPVEALEEIRESNIEDEH